MELKYRGVPYQASNRSEDVVATEQVGTYRGASFRIKSVKAALRQPGEELVYRGVRYTR